MQTDSGELTRIRTDEEYELLLAEQKEALLQKSLPKRMIVPDEDEERVVNMTRQQRRAWARAEAKRLMRGSR